MLSELSHENVELSRNEAGHLRTKLEGWTHAEPPLAADSFVFGRIGLTLLNSRDEVAVSHSLRCVAHLSRVGYSTQCLSMISDCSKELEEFIQVHRDIDHQCRNGDSAIHRDLLLAVLFSSEHRLTSADLLELYDGDLHFLLKAVCATMYDFQRSYSVSDIMELPDWRDFFSLYCSFVRILYELSTWKSYQTRQSSTKTDTPMKTLHSKFGAYCAALSHELLVTPILDIIAVVMEKWLDFVELSESLLSVHVISYLTPALQNVMTLLLNVLTFTNEFSDQLKRRLCNKTVLLQSAILPFLLFQLDIIERGQFDRETVMEKHLVPLLFAVRLLSLLSYSVKSFRPWLRKFPFLGTRILRVNVLLDSSMKTEYFAGVVRFLVNTETEDSTTEVLGCFAAFSEAEKVSAATLLSDPRDRLFPINVFSKSYSGMREIFSYTKNDTEKSVVHLKIDFGLNEECPSNSGLKRSANQKRAHRRRNQRQRYAALRKKRNPTVVAPERTKDDVEWEDVGSEEGEDCEVATLTPVIQLQQAIDTAPETKQLTIEREEGSVSDVINEDIQQDDELQKERLGKWRQKSPSVAPDEYLCALSRQIMVVPVISPMGDVFDKETILAYLKESKNKCPLSGTDLYPSDLAIDNTLKKELDIIRYNY